MKLALRIRCDCESEGQSHETSCVFHSLKFKTIVATSRALTSITDDSLQMRSLLKITSSSYVLPVDIYNVNHPLYL